MTHDTHTFCGWILSLIQLLLQNKHTKLCQSVFSVLVWHSFINLVMFESWSLRDGFP